MSGHERERLSAYLDRELDPAGRAAIEAHLPGCAECRGALAELAAVDVAARALPSEAPPGYFESLPARVRGRIEAVGARRPAWRLPAWAWAAAAALILAVVTPITLFYPRARVAPTPAATAETDAAAPLAPQRPAAVPAAPRAPAPGRVGEMASREAPVEERKADLEVARRSTPTAAAPLETQAPPEAAAPPEQPGAFAPTPRPAGAASVPFAMEGAVADRSASTAEEEAVGGAAAPPEPDSANAKTMRPAGGRARAARETAAASPSTEPIAAEQAYRALAAERPHDAEGWRRLREAWRAFAGTHASHPLGDEARVRVVEAGVEAWRAAGHEADLTQARLDASAYLARADAEQTERVRRALEATERP